MAEPRTVRVRVTQDDIDAGVRADCTGCPVALAVTRAVPGCYEALVDIARVDLVMVEGPDIFGVPLPDSAANAIAEFDAGYPMSPFDFDLPLPTLESANG